MLARVLKGGQTDLHAGLRYAEVSALASLESVDAVFNESVRQTLAGPCLWPELAALQRLCLGLGLLSERVGGAGELSGMPLDALPAVLERLEAAQLTVPWWESPVHERFVESARRGARSSRARCSLQ